MNPAFLDDMSWEMAEVYGAVTDRILINLARYFPYFKDGKVPKSAFEYQAQMLAQMGQVNRETMQIVRNGLKGADKALQNGLEQAILDSVYKTEPTLFDAVKRGIFQPAGIPAVVAPNQMRAFTLYYTQAARDLNLVNTVMLESTQQAYQGTVSDIVNRVQATQTALDIGAGETITGVESWNSALRHSVNRMKTNGITGFIDHAGRHWSAEAYTAMDIRTTLFNTGRAATWEENERFGNDLYSVSYHNGARPLCYPWQCKVISSLDVSRDIKDLDGNTIHVYAQNETTYGQAAGLFGVNCKHYATPFIPGVSKVRGEPQDPEENAKTYAESQEQRRLERKLREEKRDLEMLKAQGAPEDEIKAQRAKCRQTSADIDEFCEQTGRARHRDREAVYTQRQFPDKDKYDVTAFTNEQQQFIRNYYENRGEQQRYFSGISLDDVFTPLAPVANVAQQATQAGADADNMNYGKPFDTTGRRKPQVKQFEDAKQTLANAPDDAKQVWSKVADKLESPNVGSAYDGAYYKHSTGETYFQTYKKAFEESTYQRKNTAFFHEYGHNIDDLLGDGTRGGYYSLSYVSKDGQTFGNVIIRECGDALGQFYLHQNGYADAYEAVKAVQNGPGGMGFDHWARMMLKGSMPSAEWQAVRGSLAVDNIGDDVLRPLAEKWLKPQLGQELRAIVKGNTALADGFVKWVNSSYTIYERTDISDMFEHYMITSFGNKYKYPFGVGHGVDYHSNFSNTPTEAFAEMFSATVTQSDSLKGIKDFFPESYSMFLDMLKEAIT